MKTYKYWTESFHRSSNTNFLSALPYHEIFPSKFDLEFWKGGELSASLSQRKWSLSASRRGEKVCFSRWQWWQSFLFVGENGGRQKHECQPRFQNASGCFNSRNGSTRHWQAVSSTRGKHFGKRISVIERLRISLKLLNCVRAKRATNSQTRLARASAFKFVIRKKKLPSFWAKSWTATEELPTFLPS